MKIGLLSDTHGFIDDKIFHYFRDCDEIWHAGDIGSLQVYEKLRNFKKLRAVYGNIDEQVVRNITENELIFSAEGQRIWMLHIAGFPPHYIPKVKKRIPEISPDILICGHSHILRIMTDKNFNDLLYINPGAAGMQGFHKIRTLIRFSILKGRISDVQVIELGKRGISNPGE